MLFSVENERAFGVIIPCAKGLNKRAACVFFSKKLLCGGARTLRNTEIFKTFFREKPAMMLVELRNAKADVYASSLAKNIDCTYSHVVKILQDMEKEGLVIFDKQGRLKLLTLTRKGADVADRIDHIRSLLKVS